VTFTLTGVNVYFGGRLIGKGATHSAVTSVAEDRLGSMNGKFYPFGQERPSATTNDKEKFTGYFRDSATGLDYADQRYHNPGQGRFMTPDFAPSSRLNDPSTWNRYAYVGGDPANNTDPTGQDWLSFFHVDNNIPQAPVDLGARAGFPTNYYVDGVYTDPSVALRFLNSGAAAVCPNNFCSGFITEGGGTTFYQFMPSVDGSQGYVGLTDTVVNPTPQPVNDDAYRSQVDAAAARAGIDVSDLRWNSQIHAYQGNVDQANAIEDIVKNDPSFQSGPFGLLHIGEVGWPPQDNRTTSSPSLQVTTGPRGIHIDLDHWSPYVDVYSAVAHMVGEVLTGAGRLVGN